MTHIYIKPSSNQHSATSREASAAGRLRPNAVIGNLKSTQDSIVRLRLTGHMDRMAALYLSLAMAC